MSIGLSDLPEEIILQILKETSIQALFDSVRFVSKAYNRRVHRLLTSSFYLNYILERFDPCFKLQLSYPDGPSRPDIFMSASLVVPWSPPRNLYKVKMKLEGHFGGLEDRVMVWIDGNYKPITSLAVNWIDVVEKQDVLDSPSQYMATELATSDPSRSLPVESEVAGRAVLGELQQPAELDADLKRTGWYEGVVDWWAIYSSMAKVKPRAPGDYGKNPLRPFLVFTRLSKFDFWSREPMQVLLRQELDRGVTSDQAVLP